MLLFIFNVSAIRSIPSIVSFPQLSNLGLFIRATVSESNCPVGRSPPKAWQNMIPTFFSWYCVTWLYEELNLKFSDIVPEPILWQQWSRLSTSSWHVHVPILHQVHLCGSNDCEYWDIFWTVSVEQIQNVELKVLTVNYVTLQVCLHNMKSTRTCLLHSLTPRGPKLATNCQGCFFICPKWFMGAL